MDEQKKKPVRRISGRLTDTIRESDVSESQSVFTPRRTVRPNRTSGEVIQTQGTAVVQKEGKQTQDSAATRRNERQMQDLASAQKSRSQAQAGATQHKEEKQLQIFVPRHKTMEQQEDAAAPLKPEASQERTDSAQTEVRKAKIIHPEQRVRSARQETETGVRSARPETEAGARSARPETEAGARSARSEAEAEARSVRPERRGQASVPTPVPGNSTGKRRREQENEAKMRSLWSMLGVLVVLLVAAIIYEIVLGHGIRQTGSERMAQKKQEKIENVIEILDDTADAQTEVETAADSEGQTDAQTESQTEKETE